MYVLKRFNNFPLPKTKIINLNLNKKLLGNLNIINPSSFKIFDNNHNVFRSFYDNVVSTRLYKITNVYFINFIENLKHNIEEVEKGGYKHFMLKENTKTP